MPKASDTTQRPWFHTTTYRMGDGGAHIAFRGVDRVHRVGSIDREADAALIVEAVNLYPQHKAEREALLRCAEALSLVKEVMDEGFIDNLADISVHGSTVVPDETKTTLGTVICEALAALAQAQEAEE